MARLRTMLVGAALVAAAAGAQDVSTHSPGPSPFADGAGALELVMRADAGTAIERNRSPAAELAEHRRLDAALKGLAPERKGMVDAYVIAVALDSDPVFAREARAAGAVLARRYDAAGRTIVLAGPDGKAAGSLPRGTPSSLALALARVAELMNKSEDVLVLYTTSHGAPFGLYYHDGDSGFGGISPARLAGMLDGLGIRRRLVLLSACYSGVFVSRLASDDSAIVTAASADRTSFGCASENDWTFFGDAMINHAMRKPQSLPAAFAEAAASIGGWESEGGITPSNPQLSVGRRASQWLEALDGRAPKVATAPVGRPSRITSLLGNKKAGGYGPPAP